MEGFRMSNYEFLNSSCESLICPCSALIGNMSVGQVTVAV